ncbi:MAG TPA: hypothetical protein VGG19_04360 [Tepidisphaeraceae bacterium]|jgi:hypothetical protein
MRHRRFSIRGHFFGLGIFGESKLATILLVLITMDGFWTAQQALAQVPVVAKPSTYATYNNVTQTISYSSPTIAYDVNSNTYTNSLLQVPTSGQYSFFSLNRAANGTSVNLYSSAPRLNANGTIPAGPNASFGGLLDQSQWNGIDVVMNQCFGGGFAFNMQGSLIGSGAVAAANVNGYTFAASSDYNEVGYGATIPSGSSIGANGLAVGDFTQGWANNVNTGGANTGSMILNFQAGYQNDPFTARGSGAATPNALGFPNQVDIGGAPPAPPMNNITALGFESPTYASSDAPAVSGTNDLRTLETVNPMDEAAGSSRWAVLMAPSGNVGPAGQLTSFVVDLERQYAALIGAGVPADHIAVLYGSAGTTAAPSGGVLNLPANMLAANNFPNITMINGMATIPYQNGMDLGTIRGLVAGTAATWTGLGLTAPAATNTSSLFVYVTGHGSSLKTNGATISIPNTVVDGQYANLVSLTGITNYNPALNNPDTPVNARGATIQIALSAPLADLTNSGMDNLWVDGEATTAGAIELGAATQENTSDDSAFDVSDQIETNSAPVYYYDITMPEADWPSGAQNLALSLESPDSSDVSAFDSDLEAVTLIDDTDMADIEAGDVDTYTVTVPEPVSGLLLGAGMITLLACRRSSRS